MTDQNVVAIETVLLSSIIVALGGAAFALNALILIAFVVVRSLRRLNFLLVGLLCTGLTTVSFGYMLSAAIRITAVANVTAPMTQLQCAASNLPMTIGALLTDSAAFVIAV